MAGSFKHVVTEDGKLVSPEEFSNRIENLGDAYEAIEEMYGMIWTLASDYAGEQWGTQADPKLYVESAMTDYKLGLKLARETLGD